MNTARRPHVTLAQTVRAQVALLFGKFRPAGGLAREETEALSAERAEFGNRLVALVQAIDAPEVAVCEKVREVTRQVYGDGRLDRLPSVEHLSGLVKRSFSVAERPTCSGCRDMGGHYRCASPDEPLGAVRQGEVAYENHAWLCVLHHRAVEWYEGRERRRRGIPFYFAGQPVLPRFEYPPPEVLLPRGGFGPDAPADDPKWTSFTDGQNMGPTARWARAYVERVYGHRIEEAAPLLGAAPEEAVVESDAWRDI